jgi:hypothetical protein
MSTLKSIALNLRDHLPPIVQHLLNKAAFYLLLPATERAWWDRRLADVLACRDNAHIPRHPQAGQITGDSLITHNGLKIALASYYGYGSHRVLARNRGCHEPQEERVFQEVLRRLRPGSTMLELGSFWAFYSLWFATTVPQSRNWLVEPHPGNLRKGLENFRRNRATPAGSVQAFLGRADSPGHPPIRSVDSLAAQFQIDHLTILHSDIQGFELEMLHGADRLLRAHAIDYLFISTHSQELHDACLGHLETLHYRLAVSIPMADTFSEDGLLVFHAPHIPPLPPLDLDRKSRLRSACPPFVEKIHNPNSPPTLLPRRDP